MVDYPPTKPIISKAVLAGPLYSNGIPIIEERELEFLCQQNKIEQVIFAYSDVTHSQVMHIASRALVAGADFLLLGPEHTMLTANIPVIAVSAVRTGCGKSQTTRWLSKLLQRKGFKVAVIRHTMPYGDLEKQAVQRFATLEDLTYELIVRKAQQEADIILWDGLNNDFTFICPDLQLISLFFAPVMNSHKAQSPGLTEEIEEFLRSIFAKISKS